MKKRTKRIGPRWIGIRSDDGSPNRLSDFIPLLNFANTQLQEGNWSDTLWQAMGREKLCTVTFSTKDGAVPKAMLAADIMSNIGIGIGAGWAFKTQDIVDVTRKIEEAITEIRNDLPKIVGADPSLESVRQLQNKVKQVLDCMLAKTDLVNRQRSGEGEASWLERLGGRDVAYKLTGQLGDFSDLPWQLSHFEEKQGVTEMIRALFEASDTRRAVIHSTGFVCFDDKGEDATRTLSWMLLGLIEVVFQRERSILRKCQLCEKYFFHKTLKARTFCSDHCRYKFHNSRQRRVRVR